MGCLINIQRKGLIRKSRNYKIDFPLHIYYSWSTFARLDFSMLWTPRPLLLLQSTNNHTQPSFSTTPGLLRTWDYYKLLGVHQTASSKEIKSAYYKIAKQCHPDVNKNDSKAAAMFRKASEAYEVLCDDQKRAEYDGTGFTPPNTMQSEEYNHYQGSNEDVYSWENVDPDDDFRKEYGRWTSWNRSSNRRNHSKSQNESHEDDNYSHFTFVRERTIRISFQEAAQGTKRDIKISHPLNKFRRYKEEKLCATVNITPGIEDKHVFHVDIDRLVEVIITVRIVPSRYMKRVGANVYSDTIISHAMAKFGCKIHIEGLYGDLELEIPAGTLTKTTFNLSQQGFKISKNNKEYGDHLVFVKVRRFSERKDRRRKQWCINRNKWR